MNVDITIGQSVSDLVLRASTQTIRNTIPNAAKKEKRRIIGIPPLRFHVFQWDVNCGKRETEMDKHPYDELIEKVAEKMKEYENDDLGYGIFEKVDKDLGLGRGTSFEASGWKDYCDFVVFNDV
ncbi:hypothetical protein N9I33_01405 [Paracoccaceae bacterium]|nr:hypothetical protein [Paracoccaceae bacterium]